MRENKIILQINETTRLRRNDCGQKVFDIFIKNSIQPDCKNILVIPETITKVSISFIQGLVKNIPNKYMNDGFYKHFEINANKIIEDKFRYVLMKI